MCKKFVNKFSFIEINFINFIKYIIITKNIPNNNYNLRDF